MYKYILILSLVLIIFMIDLYSYTILNYYTVNTSPNVDRILKSLYCLLSLFTLATILVMVFFNQKLKVIPPAFLRYIFFPYFLFTYLPKLFMVFSLLGYDSYRLVKYFFNSDITQVTLSFWGDFFTSRSPAVMRLISLFGLIPIFIINYGIFIGGSNYQVKPIQINLSNLPKVLHGLRIAHISDIHTGSFFNKSTIQKGVKLLNQQKPDLIFFTGDLVNNRAEEASPYMDILKEIQAPLGVFSVLGNHDYGDYVIWPSEEHKQHNLDTMHQIHKSLGWNLLLNSCHILEKENEKIAIIGVENWGKGSYSKYGNLQKAYQGAEKYPVKLLLSHDPSHWSLIVTQQFKDIDITFSGHTHGSQFGIRSKYFFWSPVQYIYEHWAGLYQKGEQYLHVNPGFGFLGYPGRIGISPEISIIELVNPKDINQK